MLLTLCGKPTKDTGVEVHFFHTSCSFNFIFLVIYFILSAVSICCHTLYLLDIFQSRPISYCNFFQSALILGAIQIAENT